jgi:hypothetical protein
VDTDNTFAEGSFTENFSQGVIFSNFLVVLGNKLSSSDVDVVGGLLSLNAFLVWLFGGWMNLLFAVRTSPHFSLNVQLNDRPQ